MAVDQRLTFIPSTTKAFGTGKWKKKDGTEVDQVAQVEGELAMDSNGHLGTFEKNTSGALEFTSASKAVDDRLTKLDRDNLFTNVADYRLHKTIYRGYYDSNRLEVSLDPELTFPKTYTHWAIRSMTANSNGGFDYYTGLNNADGSFKTHMIDMSITNEKSTPKMGKLKRSPIMSDGEYVVTFYEGTTLVRTVVFHFISVYSASLALTPTTAVKSLVIRTNRPYQNKDNACYIYEDEDPKAVLTVQVLLEYADGSLKNVTHEKGSKLTITGLFARAEGSTVGIDIKKKTEFDKPSTIQKFKTSYSLIRDNSDPIPGQNHGSLFTVQQSNVKHERFGYKLEYNEATDTETITITTKDSNDKDVSTTYTRKRKTNPNQITEIVTGGTNKTGIAIIDPATATEKTQIAKSVWKLGENITNANDKVYIWKFDGSYINTASLTIERDVDVYVLENVLREINSILPVFYLKPGTPNNTKIVIYKIFGLYEDYSLVDITNVAAVENFSSSVPSTNIPMNVVIKVNQRKNNAAMTTRSFNVQVSYPNGTDVTVTQPTGQSQYTMRYTQAAGVNTGKAKIVRLNKTSFPNSSAISDENKRGQLAPSHFRIIDLNKKAFSGSSATPYLPITDAISEFTWNTIASNPMPDKTIPLVIEFVSHEKDSTGKITQTKILNARSLSLEKVTSI